MAQRRARMVNVDTGEEMQVLRGTPEYEELREQGWLSREQISHRKEYREDYQPDFIDEPEEETIELDESELLKDKISEMYDVIRGKIESLPDERYFHKTKQPMSLLEDKDMLLNAVDDFYADVDNDFEFDRYIESILPSVENLLNLITYDSDQSSVEFALTQLMNLLQGGTLSSSMSKLLGNMQEYNGSYSGWYERSSRFSDIY